MSTIKLQKYAPAIMMSDIDAVNHDITEVMKDNDSFTLDFEGIKGIEMEAAEAILSSLRAKFGSGYRKKVQLVNVAPIVNNAFTFSGSVGVPDSAPVSSSHATRRRRFSAAFSHIFATILLLLTLGVGQMWATVTIYAVGNMQDNGGTWRDEKTTLYCHNWNNTNSYSTTWPGTSMTKWNDVSVDGHQVFKCNLNNDNNNKCIFNTNGGWQTSDITNLNSTVKAYPYPTYLNGTWYYSPRVCKCLWESNQTVSGGYIYFDNSSANWGDTYVYLVVGHGSYVGYYRIQQISNTKLWYASLSSLGWSDAKYIALAGNSSSKTTGSGNPNNLTTLTHFSDALGYGLNTGSTYLVSMTSGTNCTPISIDYKSDGYSAFNYTQTLNQTLSTDGGSSFSASTLSLATVTVSSYKLNGNGSSTEDEGTIEASTNSTSCDAARTAIVTYSVSSVATGYEFVGWYDGSTQKSTSTSYSYTATEAKTITARFKKKQYTLSYGVYASSRWGSITLNSGSAVTTTASSTLNHGTSISFTASANSGYQVEGWYSDAACAAKDRLQSGGTSYDAGTLTAAKTVYVKFEVRTGGVITLSAETGGQVSKDNSSWGSSATYTGITTTTAKNIYARANTGYTFSSWSKTSGSGTITSTSSASTTFTPVAYEDATVTASFTETMSSLSTSISYDGANPGYSAPSVFNSATTVGYATTRTITAASPSTGYTFAGWTLTNCTRTDEGAATANPITIRSNGDGAAATVVANYTEDLSSVWVVRGDSKFGSTWSSNTNAMTKKTGHSTESVVYYTASIDAAVGDGANTAYNFKIYNTSTEKWYGLVGDGDWWYSRSSGEQTMTQDNQNIQLRADVAGPYEIKVDYSGASPKLTVTFPTSYTLTYSIGSVAGNNGSISTSPTTASGSKVLSGNTVTLTGPAAKTGYTWKGWYTDAAGTTGKITDSNRAITITMDADKTLYACYTEKEYNVTVSNDGHGTVSPTGTVAVKQVTGTELTASANTNYVFKDWTIANGGITPTTSSTNPQVFKATATGGTIRANFTPKWHIVGGDTESSNGSDDMGDWNVYANGIENLGTNASSKDTGYVNITLPAKTTFYFKVRELGTDNWYGNSGEMTYLNHSGWTMSTGAVNCRITTANAGTYKFAWNITDKKLTVTYPVDPTYTVTVTAGEHGTASPASVTAGEFTSSTTITGTPVTGYYFGEWTCTSGSVTFDNSASASTTVKATETSTVRANFVSQWVVGGSFNSWNMRQYGVENFGVNASSKDTGYVEISLAANTNYTFKLYNMDDGTWWGNNNTTQYMNYTSNNAQPWLFETGKANCGLTTAGAGNYKFAWNITDHKMAVHFPTSYTITYGKVVDNAQSIGSVSATGDDDDALTSGKYVAKGSATFTAAEAANYHFVDWRTSSTFGEGTQLSTDNPYTMTSIAENKTVYAHYAENMTTVTLNHTGNGHIEIGGATITETTAGTVTTRTIVAVPDAGWYFAGWIVSDGADCNVLSTAGRNDNEPSSTTLRGLGAGTTGTVTANFVENDKIYFRNENEDTGEKLWDVSKMYVYFNVGWQTGGTAGVTTDGSSQAEMNPISAHSHIFWAYVPRSFTEGGNGKVAFSHEWMGSSAYPGGIWDKFFGKYAVYRTDYNKHLNMYVPARTSSNTDNDTKYYNYGFWMKYNTQTDQGASYYLKENTGSGQLSEFLIAAPNGTSIYTKYRFQNTTAKTFYIANAAGTFFKSVNINSVECTDVDLNSVSPAAGFTVTPTSEGYYTFTIDQSGDTMKISVNYPISPGDYRLDYTYNTSQHLYSDIIKPDNASSVTNIKKSVYVDSSTGVSLKLQKCTSLDPTTKQPIWTSGVSVGTLNTIFASGKGVYEFDMEIDNTGKELNQEVKTVTLTNVALYTGPFYIKTDYAPGGWVSYKQNTMEQNTITFDKDDAKTFDYYFCKWVDGDGRNVKCIICNDYNEQITDTLINDAITNQYLVYAANVRFSYNSYTNELKRAYINGATDWQKSFLLLSAGSEVIKQTNGSAFTDNSTTLVDQNNWIYMIDLNAQEQARVKLTANYRYSNTDHIQYLIGESGDYSNAKTKEILGGTTTDWHTVRVIYDFKTNKLVCAWLATEDPVSGNRPINTDVLVIRNNQGDATQISLGSTSNKLTQVDTVYSALCLTKAWLTDGTKTDSQRRFYWMSFPYNVKISDIFGSFGAYGEYWIFQRYNGKKRATNGFWLESEPNWEYITDKSTVLNAYEGYVLTLDLNEFRSSNTKFWGNDVTELYEYFPSNAKQNSIEYQATKTITIDQIGYECTIDRSKEIGGNGEPLGDEYDRTVRDSYWHLIGVPSFANTNITGGFNDHDGLASGWKAANMPFFYNWDKALNKLSPASATGSTYFKPLEAYMVQYSGTTITWNAVSAPQPSSVVARQKAEAEDIHFVEFNLNLVRGEENLDHTYIRLTDNEDVTTGFEFGHDLCKEFQSGANIYTMIDQLQVAGNSLPLETEKTTIVPVGVRTDNAGAYTFSLPEGTEGVGVTLVDNKTGERTNLALIDYTVTLEKGTFDQRFTVEISPVQKTSTGIDNVQSDNVQDTQARKVMVDGVLYIIKDGKVFDAQGARIQ